MDRERENALPHMDSMGVRELTSYIRSEHHQKERELFEEIDVLIGRVLLAHYVTHSDQMVPLFENYSLLRSKLLLHFAKKEKNIFLTLKQTANEPVADGPFLDEILADHRDMREVMAKMAQISNDYTAPDDGCGTYDLMMEKLKELVSDVEVLFDIEEFTLLPKYKGELQ